MESKKVVLTLSGEAWAILDANATERKRGEFVSTLLLNWKESQTSRADDLGILESIAASVRRIEKRLEGMG